MALPLVEQIEAAIETILKGISVAAGYNYDYMNLGADDVIRKVAMPTEVNSFPVLYVFPAGETPTEASTTGPTNKVTHHIQLPIVGYASPDSEACKTALNKIRQDVEAAMFASEQTPPLLNVTGVMDLTLALVETWQDPKHDQRGGVALTFIVQYRYQRGLPDAN